MGFGGGVTDSAAGWGSMLNDTRLFFEADSPKEEVAGRFSDDFVFGLAVFGLRFDGFKDDFLAEVEVEGWARSNGAGDLLEVK